MLGFKNKKRSPRTPRTTQPPARVFSYHASRSDDSAAVGRHAPSGGPRDTTRLVRILHNLPMIVALVGIVVSIGYQLGVASSPRLVLLEPESPAVSVGRSKVAYEAKIKELLNDSILNKTKLTIDTSSLTAKIRTEFPELSDVSVRIDVLGRRPLIKLRVSEARVLLNGRDGLFALDAQGRAILPANQLPEGRPLEALPVVSDDSGVPIALGKGVLTSDEVAFISEVYEQLKAKHIAVQSMTLPALPSQLNVQPLGSDYYIKFNLQADARTSAGVFLAARDKLAADNKKPKEYIDVRVEERAYYK